MKLYLCFLLIFSAPFFLSCSESKTASSQEEVVIDDGYKTTSKGEIVFDDQSLAVNDEPVLNTRPVLTEEVKTNLDGSQVTTMYDGAGNKTETRLFDEDSLVQTLIVRTSVKGEKEFLVFAQNGSVKGLPANMQDKVLTASAREIAAAAGIYERRKEAPKPVIVPENSLTDNNFPAQTQPINTAADKPDQTENPESAPAADVESASDNPALPKQKAENPPTKYKPDELNW